MDIKTEDGAVLTSFPGAALQGVVTPPGDKSISHRAVMFGSIAEGETRVENLLEGEDVLRTVAAFQAMGVEIRREEGGVLSLQGVGLDGLAEPKDVLDMGNSGTAMRLLTGLLAGQRFFSVLTGDASLRGRPMKRVVGPLTAMGAQIWGRNGGQTAPLAIQGRELLPMDYVSPVASAQVKSAVLLAGLTTPGLTSVQEPAVSRDHTERMLEAFGATVRRDGLTVTVTGRPELKGRLVRVPSDISAATFPMVAALLVPGSDITLLNVGINPSRTGILDLLEAMGASIQRLNQRMEGGEPVADLRVRYAPLKGVRVAADVVPRAIDEFPAFFVAAAFADGETLLTGAKELRVKESDRIAAMAEGLKKLGVELEELPDGMRLQGNPQGLPGGVTVDSHTDHRIAMSFLVAGLACREPVTVTRCENIATSFPGFAALMNGLGAAIR